MSTATASVSRAAPSATWLFGGPGDFPPADFAAYAIVAAWEDPGGAERARYRDICLGYVTTLTRANSPFAPSRDLQLVTVWPVSSHDLAVSLSEIGNYDLICDRAVDSYDKDVAARAIEDAEFGSPELRAALAGRRGPFLIAWNPSEDMGNPGVPIFRMDLSDVTTRPQAEAMFRLWREGILDHADEWVDGWQTPGALLRLRLFLENYGDPAMAAVDDLTEKVKVFVGGQ